MPDSEKLDQRLRQSLATPAAPTLSPEFDQRLARQLAPRRLSARSRSVLLGYFLVGIALSLGAMHGAGMDLRLSCAVTIGPLVLVVPLLRPYFS
jgi:hypothetical protein